MGVPTIALIDTDSDPDTIDLPIPGNDDSIRAIELVLMKLADAVGEGRRAAPPDAAGPRPRPQGGRDQGGRDQGGRDQGGRDQGGRDQGRDQGSPPPQQPISPQPAALQPAVPPSNGSAVANPTPTIGVTE